MELPPQQPSSFIAFLLGAPTMRLLSVLPALSLLLICTGLEVASAPASSFSPRWPVVSFGAAPGLHLTSTTFYPTTHTGAWLVEFYSPMCGHCQKFEPTWLDVTKMSAHLADSSNFRFARVDGVAQGDLISDQKIKGYPTVRLFFDGVSQGDYKGDRSYNDLTSYVKAKAADYRKIMLKDQPAKQS
ncbi:hypothetical protein A4X13_0g706 [Tilletia indica]|uniref:Thioredoxin domain-containing protein n=2 Tax=Tilletia TaxID=13289 RepID=A0A8T8TEA8_9BASI|nr:hypothetical protein A4X13_0g706 [Tilletia indica]